MVLPEIQSLALWEVKFVAFFHIKRLVPGVDMWQCSVHSPSSERVRVALCSVAYFLIGDVACPHSSIGHKESLVCCESLFFCGFIAFCGVLVCCPSYLQSSVVGKVLSECESSVGVKVG